MEIIDILKADYERFPVNQNYDIYAENVYFKDPMTEFRGGDRYQQMISLMERWFFNIKMDLHHIEQDGNTIHTRWTLHWNTPLPWKPRISIPGSSELKINENGLICSHIDTWDISRLDVLKQHIALRASRT
ncbi:DUF2358 domain-containing protein [Roseofilum sp. BLCC_M91]|uniref:DUF2358 domain-containing protein n=1 Tax=Roseofilum halophilum BLCC-M91 TaxID=3022259 RepID=A0ABT7BEK0_9CYAN|nr:DUF2358 domain-containing protein [Roseofilum halophilum]MDJ1177587.1 DUF2358 domain-containing protein [Roseofilum halophilum BLCC-M91]